MTDIQVAPSSALWDLRGRVALITGGASGIGWEVARLFDHCGATVFIADIKKVGERADAADKVDLVSRSQVVDCAQAAQVADWVSGCAESTGSIDVLVNNAGMGLPKSLLDTSEAEMDRLYSVNVKAAAVACKQVLPYMLRSSSGSIVNVSSHGGIAGRPSDPIYCATKHAIVGLTRSLAVCYASNNIRVNALCPGPIDTPMLRGGRSEEDFQAVLPAMIASCPADRVGTSSEVAQAALFLACDASSFITGVALPIDGGKAAGVMPSDRYVPVAS